MKVTMGLGFAVHLFGMIADTLMVLRVKNTNKAFGIVSLAAVSLYTLSFFAWVIFIHIVRFDHNGKVCSGHYLDSP